MFIIDRYKNFVQKCDEIKYTFKALITTSTVYSNYITVASRSCVLEYFSILILLSFYFISVSGLPRLPSYYFWALGPNLLYHRLYIFYGGAGFQFVNDALQSILGKLQLLRRTFSS